MLSRLVALPQFVYREYNYESFLFTFISKAGSIPFMIVCVCKRINSAQIREAVEKGASDLAAVSQKLGVGTGCGRCVEYAERMIDTEKRSLGYAVKVA